MLLAQALTVVVQCLGQLVQVQFDQVGAQGKPLGHRPGRTAHLPVLVQIQLLAALAARFVSHHQRNLEAVQVLLGQPYPAAHLVGGRGRTQQQIMGVGRIEGRREGGRGRGCGLCWRRSDDLPPGQ